MYQMSSMSRNFPKTPILTFSFWRCYKMCFWTLDINVSWLFFKKDDYITLSLRKSLLGQLLDIKKDLLQSTGTKTHILLYTACSLLTYSTSYAMLHVELLRVRSVLQHMLQRKRKLVLLN